MSANDRRNRVSAASASSGSGNSASGRGPGKKSGGKKRGVVLLLVLSLLTLFIMIGVTYSLVAMNYRSASRSGAQIEIVGDNPEREMDLVLSQVLYDTTSRSSLGSHSLLLDFYGQDSVTGNATTFDKTELGGQAVSFNYTATGTNSFSTIKDYYVGRVLTFLDGSAKGLSARVIYYDPTQATKKIFIEMPDSASVVNYTGTIKFIINGAPFNGPGAGYQNAAPYNLDQLSGFAAVDSAFTGDFVALLPHFPGYPTLPPAASFENPDETWDAVDYQNMYLAMVPADSSLGKIPSYHRPDLINYWYKTLAAKYITGVPPARERQILKFPYGANGKDENGSGDDPTSMEVSDPNSLDYIYAFKRHFMFRPLEQDHPNFTGSNPNYDPIDAFTSPATFSWDVDNDGDGVPESIWIDPNLPVVTSPSGRRYKRLVAICIKDLDGRINANVHGNLQQVADANFRAETALTAAYGLAPVGSYLPRGQGYGPAEVDFLQLFGGAYDGPTGTISTYYKKFLQARYGSDQVPGAAGNDPLSIVKHHGVPAYFQATSPGSTPTWYNSPPDVWGRRAIVLDNFGTLTSYLSASSLPAPAADEIADDPYEMQFDQQAAPNDTPFTPAELERILRHSDVDAPMLPGRLLAAGQGVLFDTQDERELFTTMSSHVITSSAIIPAAQRAALGGSSGHILDLYTAKMTGVTTANATDRFKEIVPWEILHGQPFNLNRFLGNGADEDGDYVSDEPAEAFNSTREYPWTNIAGLPACFNGVNAQHSNDVDVDGTATGTAVDSGTNRYLARQLYARQLYCLMLLLMDDGFLTAKAPTPYESSLSATDRTYLLRRRIAQWAINVVDFRDPDAIMTPFEYDTNPWNGWNVDGILKAPGDMTDMDTATERDLVWGCEAPDLLLTETLAFHDRRVKDTDKETATGAKRDAATMADDDLDQFRIPQGSLFVELYCPKNRYTNNPGLPWELYNRTTGKLQLGKYVTPTAPVWRLALSELTHGPAADVATAKALTPASRAASNPESTSFDPMGESMIYKPLAGMNLLGAGTTDEQLKIDRYVWFTDGGGTPAGNVFFTAANPELSPGQYAVIAPRAVTRLGSKDPALVMPPPTTPSLWGGDSLARITMKMTAPFGIDVYDGTGAVPTPVPAPTKGQIVPIIASMPLPAAWTNQPWRVGLNITEPLPGSGAYYPEPPAHGGTPIDAYDDPVTPTGTFLDEPEDAKAGKPLADQEMLATDTYENVSSVFLQRLADPTAAYDAVTNPYITVDWATIDCTVFNGEDDTNRRVPGTGQFANQEWDWNAATAAAVDPVVAGARPLEFETRQRGRTDNGGTATTNGIAKGNIWPPDASSQTNGDPPRDTPARTAQTEDYFKFALVDSAPDAREFETLGYLNSTVATPQATPNVGDPSIAAPWLAWNNRPFTNPNELLLVPSSSPSRLCFEVTPGTMTSTAAAIAACTDHYTASGATDPADTSFPGAFAHLLNFFNTSATAGAAPHFYRLMDYVEVPSPFVGAERWYNPSQFATAGSFRPPFNYLSRFRDPGRININTVSDSRVLQAALRGLGGDSEVLGLIDKILLSRRGYAIPPMGTVLTLDDAKPTLVANPFRTADSADLMPAVTGLRQDLPVQATFLRKEFTTGVVTAPKPLFSAQAVRYTQEKPEENVYMQNQVLQKAGSVFTTRSNCFAVWMTIGYFEVEDNTPGGTGTAVVVDAAHPDGYRLGQELGADTGEIKRHRSFYIIDRSIPVAFEPGQKHNTDNCVLLRRFIE